MTKIQREAKVENEVKENGAVEKEPQRQAQVVTIEIRLRGAEIEVKGPIENKILCYGMLKMAEQAIEGWRPDAGVLPVPGMPPLRGRFGPIS